MSTFPLEGFVVLTNLVVTLYIPEKIHLSFVKTYFHSRLRIRMYLESGGQVSPKRPNSIMSLTTVTYISNKTVPVTKTITVA